MNFSVFKAIRNKKYGYVPRYYDERKERLEELKKKYKNLPDNSKIGENRKKIDFREEWNSRKEFKPAGNNSGRFFIILATLFFVAYMIIKYLGLESLFFNG